MRLSFLFKPGSVPSPFPEIFPAAPGITPFLSYPVSPLAMLTHLGTRPVSHCSHLAALFRAWVQLSVFSRGSVLFLLLFLFLLLSVWGKTSAHHSEALILHSQHFESSNILSSQYSSKPGTWSKGEGRGICCSRPQQYLRVSIQMTKSVQT